MKWFYLLAIGSFYSLSGMHVPVITSKKMEDAYMQTLKWDKVGTKWQCPVCKKTISSHKREHLRTHTSYKPFTCTCCPSTFITQVGQYAHEESMHSNTQYNCDQCAKVCKSKGKLNEHKKVMHGEKNFHCNNLICTKSFGSQSALTQHKQIVHGTKKFTCDICSSSFTKQATLDRHRNAHFIQFTQKEKNYVCPQCSSQFETQGNLNRHNKQVHTTKKFLCKHPDCHKKFKTRGDLNAHKKFAHRTGNTFACICGKSYRWKKSLTKHHKDCARYKATLAALLN